MGAARLFCPAHPEMADISAVYLRRISVKRLAITEQMRYTNMDYGLLRRLRPMDKLLQKYRTGTLLS